MGYGAKTVSKKILKTWHDGFNENRRKSTRRSVQAPEPPATSPSMINAVDVLSTIRCSFKHQEILRDTPHYHLSTARKAVDSCYLFLHVLYHLWHFYVLDTFNDDVQSVFLFVFQNFLWLFAACRKITNLATFSEDVCMFQLQELYPIDLRYTLSLHVIERGYTLHLLNIDYDQSTASSLHSLPITCDQSCNNQ